MPPYILATVTAVDREAISTIFCSSYATNAWFRLQYRGLSIEEMTPGFSLRFPAGRLTKENVWHHKLLDSELENKPIALARWTLPGRVFGRLKRELRAEGGVMGLDGESEENLARYRREREEGYTNGEPTGMDPSVPEGAAVELKKMRDEAPPEPEEFIELDALHTLPEHERKGAGTALMEWGVRLADSEHLPIRLQATEHGIGLYRKFGFVEIGRVTLDLSRWGGEGDSTLVMMNREPKIATDRMAI